MVASSALAHSSATCASARASSFAFSCASAAAMAALASVAAASAVASSASALSRFATKSGSSASAFAFCSRASLIEDMSRPDWMRDCAVAKTPPTFRSALGGRDPVAPTAVSEGCSASGGAASTTELRFVLVCDSRFVRADCSRERLREAARERRTAPAATDCSARSSRSSADLRSISDAASSACACRRAAVALLRASAALPDSSKALHSSSRHGASWYLREQNTNRVRVLTRS
eukprot:610519-Prorocentrum_minimum.AAC.2